MANDIITTLHPDNDQDTNLYPNIKRENIPNGAVDKSKLDNGIINEINDINDKVDNLEGGEPRYVNISTNILALTENKGVAVATDTGHWYYWNGSQYVDGGVYQSTSLSDENQKGVDFALIENKATNNLSNFLIIKGDGAEKTLANLSIGSYTIEFHTTIRAYYIIMLGSTSIHSGFLDSGYYKLVFENSNDNTNLTFEQYMQNENPIAYDIKLYKTDNYNKIIHLNDAYPTQTLLNPYDFDRLNETAWYYKDDEGLKISVTPSYWQVILKSRNIDLSGYDFDKLTIEFDVNITADVTTTFYLGETEVDRIYNAKKHFKHTFYKTDIVNANLLNNFYVQIACGANLTIELLNIVAYFDNKGSSFKQQVNHLDFYKYPLEKIIKDGGLCKTFKSIMCIGDSLTEGVFDYNDGGLTNWAVISEYSYPTQLGRILGNNIVNAGNGGTTCKTWYNSMADTYLISGQNCDAYIIALGTNDIGDSGEFVGNIATDIDLSDYNNNADNSVGYYARIIQRILSINSKAKIFCVTIPNTRNGSNRYGANEKIRDIANLLNCYIIDLECYYVNNGEVNNFKSKYYNGGHLNALGYLNLAYVYSTYIDYIIKTNISDFKEIQFIDTDYNFE